MDKSLQDNLLTLVERFQKGDREAFGRLWQQAVPIVFAWLRQWPRGMLSEVDCEDLCSDVMMKLYQRAGDTQYKNALHFFRWLRMVTVNCKTDYIRRRGRGHQIEEKLAIEAAREIKSRSTPDSLENNETRQSIHKAIVQLDETEELLLNLHFHQEKTFPEIAKILEGDVSKAGKYKKRYYRILNTLKKYIVTNQH